MSGPELAALSFVLAAPGGILSGIVLSAIDLSWRERIVWSVVLSLGYGAAWTVVILSLGH